MRVLILANDSAGLYRFREKLITELMKSNEVIVSTPITEEYDNLVKLGCTVVETAVDRRGMNPIKDIRLIRTYRALVKRFRPDYVITYTIKPNIYGGWVSAKKKIPYAVNVTGLGTAFQKDGLLKKVIVAMYRRALRRAKVVFFENQANCDLFVKEKIVPCDKTHVLSGAGVDLQHFRLKDYPIEQSVTRFLFIGRMMQEKGIEELFSCCQRLSREGNKIHLSLVGISEENYADILSEGEREGWLTYHGYQSDVRPFIEQSHCFVLPSWHEGMANTNLESAAMGRPVITSDIPGCREAVIHGVTGLLAESRNAQALYDAMKRMIDLSVEERRQMGLAGRKHMEAVFDKQKVVEDTIRHL